MAEPSPPSVPGVPRPVSPSPAPKPSPPWYRSPTARWGSLAIAASLFLGVAAYAFLPPLGKPSGPESDGGLFEVYLTDAPLLGGFSAVSVTLQEVCAGGIRGVPERCLTLARTEIPLSELEGPEASVLVAWGDTVEKRQQAVVRLTFGGVTAVRDGQSVALTLLNKDLIVEHGLSIPASGRSGLLVDLDLGLSLVEIQGASGPEVAFDPAVTGVLLQELPATHLVPAPSEAAARTGKPLFQDREPATPLAQYHEAPVEPETTVTPTSTPPGSSSSPSVSLGPTSSSTPSSSTPTSSSSSSTTPTTTNTSNPTDTTKSNAPPFTPSSPMPPDAATLLPLSFNLQWVGGDQDRGQPVTYNVYLATTNPPLALRCAATPTPSCPTGTLTAGATYYWKVVSSDGTASTTGPIWSFTTDRPPNPAATPAPTDGATNQPNPNLSVSWVGGGDPDTGQPVTYTVLFGTTSNPTVTAPGCSNIAGTTCALSGLVPATTYYWRITTSSGTLSTSGPVWHFATALLPCSPGQCSGSGAAIS